MLGYITRMPQESDSDLVKFKLPFISGQLLAIENNLIYQAFFGIDDDSGEEDEPVAPAYNNLQTLMSYFKTDNINPLLTGYCQKVYSNLFRGRRTKMIQAVFDSYLTDLIKHMENANVTNMVKKIITIQKDNKEPQTFKEQRMHCLSHLLFLYGLRNHDYRQNVVSILTQLISRRLLILDGPQLFQVIISQPKNYMLHSDKIDEPSCRLLKHLLSRVNTKQAVQEDEDNNIYLTEQFLDILTKWLIHNFSVIVSTKITSEPIKNQAKQSSVPFGTVNYSVVDCLRQAVRMQNAQLNNQIALSAIPEQLVQLCQQHKYNGILHTAFCHIVIGLLQDDNIMKQIVKKWISIVMQTFKNDNSLMLGHLTNIMLTIYDSKSPDVQEAISDPTVTEFIQDVIMPRKQKNQFKWAGNITNLKAAPHNFVDDDPTEIKKVKVAPAEPIEEPIEEKQEDDFYGAKKEEEPAFNPFAAFTVEASESNKTSQSDFGAFDDFSI